MVQNSAMMGQHQMIPKLISDKTEEENNLSFQIYQHHLDTTIEISNHHIKYLTILTLHGSM